MKEITQKQIEELKKIQNIEDLVAKLDDFGIKLTEKELKDANRYFETGKMELEDEELEIVAGGADKPDYEKMARADGRTIAIDNRTGFCDCFIEQVWARKYVGTETITEKGRTTTVIMHEDVKCYSCGRTLALFKNFYGETLGIPPDEAFN